MVDFASQREIPIWDRSIPVWGTIFAIFTDRPGLTHMLRCNAAGGYIMTL